jgi:hypothetical protein
MAGLKLLLEPTDGRAARDRQGGRAVLAGLELLLQPLIPSQTGCEEALDLAVTTRI